MQIKKRNSNIVDFDVKKIKNAIEKAYNSLNMKPNHSIIEEIVFNIENALVRPSKEMVTVEQIQDAVEISLFNHKEFEVMKAYITYRYQHNTNRDIENIMKDISLVDGYVNNEDWRIKESANSRYSLQGLNQHVSTAVTANYWLNKIYNPRIAETHKKGDLHIHDLGFLSVYCVGWDLEDLLKVGFTGVEGKIQSLPPKHFKTALGQIVNFFYTMQGESAGAQAFSSFDTLLAPFIRKDNLSIKEVKQALQEFMFNMNTPTRVGFQTPFTNVTMDLQCPNNMKTQPIIIGGEVSETECYGDFQKEMDIFNKAFAEVMIDGDASGRLFSFPIPTYNITKEFDYDNPVIAPVWEMTAKYGIPNFSNFVNSDMSPDDVRSMCCRLRLDKRELAKRGGGLFGANPLTGSIGVVTINLPRLGYTSSSMIDLKEKLYDLMTIAKESLEIKRKTIEKLTDDGLYPYSKFYLRHLYKKNKKYWNNHFSTIGLVGMNECITNFLGDKENIGSIKGLEMANEIMEYMRDVLQEFQEETGNIYNLEATPAEGTTYRLARLDKKYYPEILTANEGTEHHYYSNSTQLPVNYTNDIFEALKLQDPLQTKYTGGTTFHIYVGEDKLPIESVKALVKKVCSNFHLPYFTISPVFSICPNHGYIYGDVKECPKCGAKNEVYTRIVGYLRPVDQWNDGKQAEYNDRLLYDKEVKHLKREE